MTGPTLPVVGREVGYDADLARRVIRRWLLNVSTGLAVLLLLCSAATLAAVLRFELADYRTFAVRSTGDPYVVRGFDNAEQARDEAMATATAGKTK